MTAQDRYHMTSFDSRRRWFGRLAATHDNYRNPWLPYYPPGRFTVTAWSDETLAQKVYERLVRTGASASMRLYSHRTGTSYAFGEPWYPPDSGARKRHAESSENGSSTP